MGSHEIARRWADALDGVVAPVLTRMQIEDLLTGLTERLVAAICDDLAPEVAHSAAAALVEANYRDEATVRATVPIICRDMMSAATAGPAGLDTERLRERAITVAAEFAAGFTATLRSTALVEQESTLAAALAAAREARAQRQLSEARFTAIFAGASVGIGTIDATTGMVLDANAAMADMLGVPTDQIPGRAVAEVLGADNTGPAYDHYEQLRAGVTDRFRVETEVIRPDGHRSVIDLSMSAVRDAAGQARVLVGVCVDITERKALADQLWHDAHHDHLTGLPNRVLFFDRLTVTTPPLGLCYLDLDGFKEINDEYGHTVGDRVLRVVADRLRLVTAPDGLAARLGGDEFIVLMAPCADAAQLEAHADRIAAALVAPIDIDGRSLAVGASVGTTLVTRHPEKIEDLVHAVDAAMYRNKSARGRPHPREF